MCIKRFIDGHNLKALVGKVHDNRGQAMTFFGLLIPLLFMFVCVGLDLGWYYLNVSRLQNAADAAALAGAQELAKDTENFSDVKGIFLVKNYLGTADDTDISAGNAVAEIYADKNLSGGDGDSVTNSWTNGNVTDIETLYKDDDGNFYYVVHLVENIRHFLMPGWFNDMSAPVVAIAMLSKDGSVPPEEIRRELILDANGGELTDDEGKSGTRRTVKANTETDTLLPTKATINLKKHDKTSNEELLFIGWNTKADGSGTTYGDGKSFTKDELNQLFQLFGTDDTVVLYAQWERRNIYIAGDSLYNAMKGNSKQGTKGLEEQMTYNTWYALYKLGKDAAYSVYPDGGCSVYNGGRFRTETTNINSSEVSAKKNNFTLFLDLGSDLMYEDSSGKGGLFKTSWDLANIATDGNGDTLTSIKANANSGKLSKGTLTISSDGNTNNVYGYYSGSGWWTTSLVDKLKFNFKNSSRLAYTDAVKYRVHTSFNFDAVFPVRSGRNKTTSPKYVNGYAVPATDPLYVRIESEELNEADGDKQNTTARQMFININADNTASNARPLIIFYEGPDRGLTEGVDDSEKSDNQSGSPKDAYPNLTWRDSQPVILNLNADFSGILFAPNSPVAINGNGHNLHGFVVAKEFVRVTTASDYTLKDGKYLDSSGKEWFKSSQTSNGITNTVFVDEYGNVDTRPLANATRPLGEKETLAGVPKDDAINQYKAQNSDMEVVYKLSAFNLGSDSYYDSFDIPELKRNVYTYEDNYTDDSKTNSVDMFFTTVRSRWIT